MLKSSLLTQIRQFHIKFCSLYTTASKITLKSCLKSTMPNGVVAYRKSTQCPNRLGGGSDGDWLGSGVGAVFVRQSLGRSGAEPVFDGQVKLVFDG